jgi:hypothetical protein
LTAGSLVCALIGSVPANDATGHGAQCTVMTDIMPGRATDDGAFDAALCGSRFSYARQRQHQDRKIKEASHDDAFLAKEGFQ